MLYFYIIVFWIFRPLCFSDDYKNFEDFPMPSILAVANSAWDSELISGVQMKMIMLIQHVEKKENLSSKSMKWVNGFLPMLS